MFINENIGNYRQITGKIVVLSIYSISQLLDVLYAFSKNNTAVYIKQYVLYSSYVMY